MIGLSGRTRPICSTRIRVPGLGANLNACINESVVARTGDDPDRVATNDLIMLLNSECGITIVSF